MSWFEHGTSRINYETYGNGDPVLLMPGFARSIEEFSALKEVLATAGYKVITADLPGSGRSEPQPRAYTGSYYEDDARSFAALLQHLGVGEAHLMGFSDGGEISLLMAAMLPGIARSVVTWGAAGVIRDAEGQLREAMYNVVDNPIPPLQPFSKYLVATYGEANARTMTRSVVGAFSEIIERKGGDISLSKAGNITCPVLLITGEHDFLAPPTLIAELSTHIGTAEVLTVDGAGHEPLHNTRLEWLSPTLLEWLKRH